MSSSDFSYADLKKVEELRKDLLAAFASSAAMRLKKRKLEKSLARIEAKLSENDRVSEILRNPKYRHLAIVESKDFLRDVEAEAVKRSAKKKRADKGDSTARVSTDRKRDILAEFASSDLAGDKKLTTKMFEEWLAKTHKITTNAKQFLKPLGIPAESFVAVNKESKRAGTYFKLQPLKSAGIISK
jgi:hypothetical protein